MFLIIELCLKLLLKLTRDFYIFTEGYIFCWYAIKCMGVGSVTVYVCNIVVCLQVRGSGEKTSMNHETERMSDVTC